MYLCGEICATLVLNKLFYSKIFLRNFLLTMTHKSSSKLRLFNIRHLIIGVQFMCQLVVCHALLCL